MAADPPQHPATGGQTVAMRMRFPRVVSRLLNGCRQRLFLGALLGAHRFSRSVNPSKIPFFLLGGRLCERYEALGWREKIVYQALQRRWDAKR